MKFVAICLHPVRQPVLADTKYVRDHRLGCELLALWHSSGRGYLGGPDCLQTF